MITIKNKHKVSRLKKLWSFVGLCAASSLFACSLLIPMASPPVPSPVSDISIPEKLPKEMTPLSEVGVLTRAGLAVLLMVELRSETFQGDSKAPIVVDVSDHWARAHILRTVQLGLMPVFNNHRFQPDLPVTRGEMAQVLAGILSRKGVQEIRKGIPPGFLSDLTRNHLYYPAVKRVLEAGLMDLDSSGRFFVARRLSGLQALGYLKGIKRLINRFTGHHSFAILSTV